MNGDKSDHTCFWTRDVRYAKNFEKNKEVVAEDVYYEKKRPQELQKEVRTMDKVKNITDLQAELDRRTAVEKLAEKLIIAGKFEEAKELLDTLDDDKARELMEAGEQQEIFSHKNVETTRRYIGVKEHTEKAIDLYLKVNCNSDIPKHNFEKLNDVINEIVALQEKGTKLNVRILANMK